MQLTFYGAAAEVTGSCYLVEAETGAPRKLRFMFDCGMFQGGRESSWKNLFATCVAAIVDRLHWRDVVVPKYAETFTLN